MLWFRPLNHSKEDFLIWDHLERKNKIKLNAEAMTFGSSYFILKTSNEVN